MQKDSHGFSELVKFYQNRYLHHIGCKIIWYYSKSKHKNSFDVLLGTNGQRRTEGDRPSVKTRLPTQHTTDNSALYNFVHVQKILYCISQDKIETILPTSWILIIILIKLKLICICHSKILLMIYIHIITDFYSNLAKLVCSQVTKNIFKRKNIYMQTVFYDIQQYRYWKSSNWGDRRR